MNEEKKNKPGFWQIFRSTFAAALGVQNDKNRQADFSNSSPMPYIIAGILFTFVFITSIILIVKYLVL